MIESLPPPIEQCTLDENPNKLLGGEQYTYDEVARLKRVKKQTVQEWVKHGMIPSPVYTGFTARFTEEQVAEIMCGTGERGKYPVAESPRARIAKQAREAAARAAEAAAAAALVAKQKRRPVKGKATTAENTRKKSKPAKTKPGTKGAK